MGVFANENNEIPKNAIQKTINNYILEVYKLQWDKIISDLDANLEKVTSTKEAKFEAYSSIQETLKLKKIETEKSKTIWENSRKILIKYLEYMISQIELKKSSLK